MTDRDCNTPMLVVAALLIERHRVLVSRRPFDKPFGGYWEFPGGKVEPREDPKDALVRELREELGVEVVVQSIEDTVLDRREGRDVLLLFYRCDRKGAGKPERRQVQDWMWADWAQLGCLNFPPADLVILPRLQRLLEDRSARKSTVSE